MPDTLQLVGRGPISYSSASKQEHNVLNRLNYVPAVKKLYHELWRQKDSIAALTKHHLGLDNHATCTVLDPREWIQGSFNVCVFVEVISGGKPKKFVFRCPMPHKLSGILDEKLSCEIGAYVWMQEQCPDIRIPHLFGFGCSDGRQFTHSKHRPFYIRIAHTFRRGISSLLQRPILSQYIHHPATKNINLAYTLLEYIGPETGEMLSNTWETFRGDPIRRERLFQGLARIILSLSRVAQPRIGSFQFNTDGSVALTNRPLSCSVAILENDGADRTIESDYTYSCTEAFVSDMLTFHDHRFLRQPNSVLDENDCRGQMAVKTMLRAISHRYIKRNYRNGPFLLQFTDFNQSNIIVDQEWNVTCLIDLEWICALPVEMLDVPYWLTGCSIEDIIEERYKEYDEARQEFTRFLEEEERKIKAKHDIPVTHITKEMWKSKGMWFWHCISSVNAMDSLWESHLCPSQLSTNVEKVLSKFWCENADDVVPKKLAEKEKYDEELKAVFQQ